MILTTDEDRLFLAWSKKRVPQESELALELAESISKSAMHIARASLGGGSSLRQWMSGLLREAKTTCLRRQWNRECVLFRDDKNRALIDAAGQK